MSAPILLDLTHTSHTRARTGVQRVARALWREWNGEALPVCHDPYERAWRRLDRWEIRNLENAVPSANRKARWPLRFRLRGWLKRLGRGGRKGSRLGFEPMGSFFCPEIFSPAVARALPEIFAAAAGPRAAMFHDAAALQFPELTPAKTVGRYPAYLRELLCFDGIAAISEESRDALVDYWRWLGVRDTPPVVAIVPGVDLPIPAFPARSPESPRRRSPPASEDGPAVLYVSTIEGRKNHLALLDACELLWSGGLAFELRLIGLIHPRTGRAAGEKIKRLRRAGRPLRYDGAVDDSVLESAYAACAFTVYPSLAEGFGLPIAEGLARGKPCVCFGRGAAGELARGGGCLAIDDLSPAGIAEAIGRLLRSPAELAVLAAAARGRLVRTWGHYARDLTAWLQTLPRRD